MRRTSVVLAVLGTLNVLAGLASWPLGFGEFAATAYRINSNYSQLVESGEIVESARGSESRSVRSQLFAGVEQTSFNQATLLGVLLIVQGVVLIAVAAHCRGTRSGTAATSADGKP